MPRKPKVTTEDDAVKAEVNSEPKVKHPIPDGFDKPSDFALHVKHFGLWNGTDAQIFNFTKGAFAEPKTKTVTDDEGNTTNVVVVGDDGQPEMTTPNGFPAVIHTDGRKIIKRDDAITWLNAYAVKRAASKALANERAEKRNQAVILSVGRYTITAARLAAAKSGVSELATIAD